MIGPIYVWNDTVSCLQKQYIENTLNGNKQISKMFMYSKIQIHVFLLDIVAWTCNNQRSESWQENCWSQPGLCSKTYSKGGDDFLV